MDQTLCAKEEKENLRFLCSILTMRAFHDNHEPSKIDSEDLIVSYEKTFGALALLK